MMRQLRTKPGLRLALLLGLGLGGCAVYRPVQCAAPAVQDKGQVELVGSAYFNTRLNGAINYSPVRHLLLRAAVDGKGDSNDSTYSRIGQYELAAGTYWPLGRQVLLGALGGVGQAHSQVRYNTFETNPITGYEYAARYNKYFGEAYATVQIDPTLSIGVAYRLTQVQFMDLTEHGQPLNLRGMLRGEPMVFVRGAFGRGPRGERPLYAQVGCGGSALLSARPGQNGSGPAGNLLESRSYFTLGLGFFPSALFRRP